jgi:hypothetical protein
LDLALVDRQNWLPLDWGTTTGPPGYPYIVRKKGLGHIADFFLFWMQQSQMIHTGRPHLVPSYIPIQ